MREKGIISLFFLLFLYSLLICGTTGKISGVLTDADTGEPLIGVNVIVERTALGAATDVDGAYVILNVPPGLYTMTFSYIGYQAVRVMDVRVNVDFTTRLNQKLTQTTLEMEAVEVFGERNPLVRQDLTNTQVAVTSETIDELPVRQIRDVIQLQAGVVVDNSGAIHIRGGRSNEIAYQVNGLSINNPFRNSQGVGLATNAVQEVSVSAGTFSAEYGNALSGVINYVTKDGGSKFHGTLRLWTGDHLSTHDDIFYNINEFDPLNNQRYEATISGPVPFLGRKLTFFVSGVYQNDRGHLYGQRIYNTDDLLFFLGQDLAIDPFGLYFTRRPNNTIQINGSPQGSERIGANGDGEIVPMVTREDFNFAGKLTWKPTNSVKLSYDLIYDDGDHFNRNAHGINVFRRFRFTPDGRPRTLTKNLSQSFGLTHTLSKKTFYTLKFGVNYNKALTSVFEDINHPGYIPLIAIEPVGQSININLLTDIRNQIIPPTETYVGGGTDLTRAQENARSILVKLDVVSQVLPTHEIKIGGEFVQDRLDYENFVLQPEWVEEDSLLLRFIKPLPEINPEFTDYQAYIREPIRASAYILDKIELAKRFILNAGLRYEYFDPRAIYNPDLAGTADSGVDDPAVLKEAEPKHRLMPRLSLSFPITSRGIIRFSYGIFYQYPQLFDIYRNPRFEDFDFNPSRPPTFGNPNLKPERSIQYELGLQQQFTDDIKMDLTVFYKDVNDLIEDRRIIAGEVAFTKQFNVYTNIGYAKVQGFTVSFIKRKSARGIFSATLDYTFQVGQGSFTDPLDLAIDTRTGRVTGQKLVPLSFDRSHVLNGSLTLSKANNWLISAIGELRHGTPYTPDVPNEFQAVEFEVNSDRRPWFSNIDLRLEKFFKLKATRFSIFLQVENLLDTKNEIFVHTTTGSSLTSIEESQNPRRFNALRETIEKDQKNYFPVKFLDDFYQREDWLSEPREVFVGMTFDF